MRVITTKNGSSGTEKFYNVDLGKNSTEQFLQEIIADFRMCLAEQADFFLEFEEV